MQRFKPSQCGSNPHIICKTLAVNKIRQIKVSLKTYNVSAYALGFSYCTTCQETFYQKEIHCQCCHRALRFTTRDKHQKRIINESIQTMKKLKKYGIKIKPIPKYKLSNLDFAEAQKLKSAMAHTHKLLLYRSDPNHATHMREYVKRQYNKPENRIRRFFIHVDIEQQKIQTQMHVLAYRTRYNRAKDFTGFRSFMRLIEK